jgi:hypothetical protein
LVEVDVTKVVVFAKSVILVNCVSVHIDEYDR